MNKQKIYLVGDTEMEVSSLEIAIVLANSSDEAIEKYIKNSLSGDDSFTKHAHEFALNAGFSCRLWMQNDEEMEFWEENSEVLIDKDEFNSRVRRFFGDHTEYADIYIKEYWSESNDIEAKFPSDMVLYMRMNSPDWCQMIALELSEIRHID